MLTNCLKRYPLSSLVTFAIIVLSVVPVPEIEIVKDVPLMDKWVHFVMYGALALVVWFEMAKNEKKTGNKLSVFSLLCFGCVLPALLGGVLEFVQEYLTATRSGDVWDFIADAVGAVLGTLLGLVVRYLVKR